MGRLIEPLRRWWADDAVGVATWALTLLLATITIVVVLWPGPEVRSGEPMIRVRVQRGLSGIDFSGSGMAVVRLDGGKPVRLRLPVEVLAGEEARVRAGGKEVGTAGEVIELKAQTGSSLQLLDRVWNEPVRVRVRDGGLDVVIEEPMEGYVAGVLSGELLSAWPTECFRAQAIASRSYAAQQISRASGRAYDVDVDERDQVFVLGGPLEKAVEAARSTRGLILTDAGGQPLRAYFSSTCGGRSAWARQIWPARGSLICNDAEPLNGPARAHACHDAPLYRWDRARGVDEVSERVRRWGEQVGHAAGRLGRVTAIEVVERAPSGRPGWFEVKDSVERRVRIKADDLRVAMNHAGERALERGRLLPSNDFEVEINRDAMTVRGRGYGHGVGLCQYCAAEWARQGFKAEQMLGAFYPGAAIECMYE